MTPAYRANYAGIDWSKPIEISRPAPGVVQRSAFPCPRIASDVMEPTQSMLDGKLYDSKSALRRTYRQAGVVEIGNDPARLKKRLKPRVDPKSVAATIDKAEARFNRGERANRAGRHPG